MRKFTRGLAALTLAVSSAAYAQREDPEAVDPPVEPKQADGEVIVIQGEAPYVPVASKSVRDRDLKLRPRPRPADILRVVPGIFVNQHAGGGKANQYFLRGFDADHGTDIALSVDGIPANMVSHGHGQGYADLNWVIPELVYTLDVFKGPYSARHGDFATAGAIDMLTYDAVDKSSISVTTGRFDTYRLLGITSPAVTDGWRSLFAGEANFTNGPFESGEGFLRYNSFAKVTRDMGSGASLALGFTSYGGGWDGSGQIPERGVEDGGLDRFGSLDPTEGGNSARHSAYLRYRAYPDDRSEASLLAYAVRYRLSLYSNFTFFANDATNGDQIEQTDDRFLAGLAARYRFRRTWRSIPFATTIGMRVRTDTIDNELYRTRERERLDIAVDASVSQVSIGLFAQEDIAWTRWLRTVVGGRLDYFGFQVTDHLDDMATLGDTGSGVRERAIASPKASLVVTPMRGTDLYANFGLGFHSNDARAVVRRPDRGTPLARATGYELGARTRFLDRFDIAGSLWLLDLDSEIVWVGDEGVTEARGPTRRYGAELEVRAAIVPWLIADTDLTLARARFRDLPDGMDYVPLAPRFTVTAGVSAPHPSGWFGRLGLRSLSDRPLTEDDFLAADGFTLLDLTAGYRTDRFEVMLSVDNLLNAEWREAQFATVSRLATDPPTDLPPPPNACPAGTRVATDGSDFAGCEDVHFAPGAPLNLMVTARLFF